MLNYRLRGREYRYTIGAWPDWSALKAVRDGSRICASALTAARTHSTIALPPPATVTVASVLDDFIVRHARNKNQPLRSADEYVSAFKRLVKPRIGKLGIYEVRRSHVIKMLDEIEDENGPVMADRTLAYVRKAFNWYATRDDQFDVPVVRGMARVKPKERARTAYPIRRRNPIIWPALGEAGTSAPLSRCCCSRRSDAMRWRT